MSKANHPLQSVKINLFKAGEGFSVSFNFSPGLPRIENQEAFDKLKPHQKKIVELAQVVMRYLKNQNSKKEVEAKHGE